MKKFLLVVHRFYPYPGGSEAYMYWLAQELVGRSCDVTVLADANKGDVGSIKVTSDYSVLNDDYDLIIVHGCDCVTQDRVLVNKQKSKMLYLIVLPSDSATSKRGMENADYLGHSTVFDVEHIIKCGYEHKMVDTTHGIHEECVSKTNHILRSRIPSERIIISVSGFWSNYGMLELCDVFNSCNTKNTTLCFFGYAVPELAPKENDKVKVFIGEEDHIIRDAIASADLYISNARYSGFGLAVLEAMINRTPWASRPVGIVPKISDYGIVYNGKAELRDIIDRVDSGETLVDVDLAHDFVRSNYMIKNTVDKIMGIN